MKNLIILTIIAFILIGCEKEIELDNKYAKHKLVVNALLEVDSTVNVAIFKSNLPLEKETSFLTIKDAEVILKDKTYKYSLSYHGKDTIFLGQDANFYTSDHIVKENTEYTIKVNTKEFGSTTSTIKIPTKPIIENFKFIKREKYNSVSFELNDKLSEENYYFFSLYYMVMDSFIGEYQAEQALFSDNETAAFESYGSNKMISDKLFNGSKYKVVFNINYDKESDDLLGSGPTDGEIPFEEEIYTKVILKVSTINKAYYNYVISINEQLSSQGDPFSEVAAISNNIENGIGVFGVKNTAIYEKDL